MTGQRGPGVMTTEPITPELLNAIRRMYLSAPSAGVNLTVQDLLAEVDRLRAALAEARREGAVEALREAAKAAYYDGDLLDRADAIERGE